MGIPIVAPYLEKPKSDYLKGFVVRYFALTDNEGTFTHSNGDGSACAIYGYIIMHDKEPLKMLYITDTAYVRWRFSNMNTLLLGIDYLDEKIVNEKDEFKRRHVISGHMELKTGIEFIKVTDRDKTLKNVIIGHLSEDNSDYNIFEDEISKVTNANVNLAKKGAIYELI